jgi:DNA-binding IclR family transcriptional regulator
MGRKTDPQNADSVLNIITANNGQVRANDIARQTGMHPEAVSRLLASMDKTTGVLLQEDDNGFLGIFRRREK